MTMDFFEFLDLLDRETERIGWSLSRFKKYVFSKYGKKSRYLMTDEQLWELYDDLKSLPTKKKTISLPQIGLRK